MHYYMHFYADWLLNGSQLDTGFSFDVGKRYLWPTLHQHNSLGATYSHLDLQHHKRHHLFIYYNHNVQIIFVQKLCNRLSDESHSLINTRTPEWVIFDP